MSLSNQARKVCIIIIIFLLGYLWLLMFRTFRDPNVNYNAFKYNNIDWQTSGNGMSRAHDFSTEKMNESGLLEQNVDNDIPITAIPGAAPTYLYTDMNRSRRWSNNTKVEFRMTNGTVCGQSQSGHTETFVLKEYTRIGWQEVIQHGLYVYSAHQDPLVTEGLMVHVVGQIRAKMTEKGMYHGLSCQLWQDPGGIVAVTDTFAYRMATLDSGSLGVRMKCFFNTTRPTSSDKNVIAIVNGDKCQRPSNLIRIQNVLAEIITNPDNFRMCIGSPMRRNFSDYQRFVEYMEINEILGAQKATLYYHDSTELTRKFVEYYAAERSLKVIPWEMPWSVLITGRNQGQSAALQDCVLYEAFRTRYVGQFDTDETIVPRGDAYTWSDMIEQTNCPHKSVLVARHALFHRDRDDDVWYNKSEVIRQVRPLMLLKSARNKDILPCCRRPKSIFKPERIEYVHLHHSPLRISLHETQCLLDPEVGLMHHYRIGGTPNFASFLNESVVVDRTAHKYAGELIPRLLNVFQAVLNFTVE